MKRRPTDLGDEAEDFSFAPKDAGGDDDNALVQFWSNVISLDLPPDIIILICFRTSRIQRTYLSMADPSHLQMTRQNGLDPSALLSSH